MRQIGGEELRRAAGAAVMFFCYCFLVFSRISTGYPCIITDCSYAVFSYFEI